MEATVVFLGLTDSAPENQGQSPSSTAQQVVLPMQPQGSVGGKGSSCRGEQTGVFTLNPFHLSQKKAGRLPKSVSHSFSAAPGEVCMQRRDVVLVAGILRRARAG